MRPERDRSKLPKWAQGELGRLERDVKYYKEKLAAGPEESDTFADPYGDAPRPLGKEPLIQFVLTRNEDGTPKQSFRVGIDRRGREVTLGVMSVGTGQVAVLPRASNSFEVTVVGL